MSIEFLLLGRGFGGRGGRECRFYFYGREDFSDRHSSDQKPKDVNSKNSNYCPEFVSAGIIVLCKGKLPRCRIFCVFTLSEFLSHLPRNSRASRTEIQIFCLLWSFVVFCGLLWSFVALGLFEGTCAHGIRRGRLTHVPSRMPHRLWGKPKVKKRPTVSERAEKHNCKQKNLKPNCKQRNSKTQF